MKLKFRAGEKIEELEASASDDLEELSAAAILATPRCHPDGAAIRRSEKVAAIAESQDQLGNGSREQRTDLKSRVIFDALGWHMAERMQQTPLLAGDSLDIAFTIGHNDHPEYGGLELSLRDFKTPATTNGSAHPAAPSPR